MHAEYLVHLKHTLLARLHVGTATSLICTAMKHTCRSLTIAHMIACMSYVGVVLPFRFADRPGELSRVSQVRSSCASFWQGLIFAVQKAVLSLHTWDQAGVASEGNASGALMVKMAGQVVARCTLWWCKPRCSGLQQFVTRVD